MKIKSIKYRFSADFPLRLHHDIPTVTIRGAFGYALADILGEDKTILTFEDKIRFFKDIFKPEDPDLTNAGYYNPPRCFVLRGGFVAPTHKIFICELLLFGDADKSEPLFDKVMNRTAARGLGPNLIISNCEKIASEYISLQFPQTNQIVVEYMTPTRIKFNKHWCYENIPFQALLSRLIDRVEELRSHFEINYTHSDVSTRALKNRAYKVDSELVDGWRFDSQRTSTRSGDTIRLDGFVGRMAYSGDLCLFADYLKYLPWVHVGKSNVFGCGWTQIECLTLQNF